VVTAITSLEAKGWGDAAMRSRLVRRGHVRSDGAAAGFCTTGTASAVVLAEHQPWVVARVGTTKGYGRMIKGLWFLALLACAACGQVIVNNGIEVYASRCQRALSEIGPRASIDLDCPASDLQLALLRKQGKVPVSVGVSGCGHRAIYARLLRSHFGRATTKNTVWELETLR
jgi:hypothetical protein